MTFSGGYRAFNRLGIAEGSSSPYLQMSFETTATFLTEAAVRGDPDRLQSPSARIVMGQLAKQGTGAFELMADLSPPPSWIAKVGKSGGREWVESEGAVVRGEFKRGPSTLVRGASGESNT
eukprot:CAMPEP_0182539836 /NCGR_PEP_ID=MMETSP1323-20130603/26061_1 /TAXON_ID=236787 /ORGANISM="Florenciella parvula, Strain RCC1693" /LENGTH=120 /DNA_ID=CAMNT_0024750441 /DNA_START=11 /DNA_END=370 /DNA_ORIENTATION=-